MNRRMLIAGTTVVALLAFGGGAYLVTSGEPDAVPKNMPLVRDHSPVLGAPDAPVTIVEFFDPACEACREFHPVIKSVLKKYPTEVRVVMRYAAFHDGSDEAVRILEAARAQGKFLPVLEAILEAQPRWASHGAPNMPVAWRAAGAAGLDIERARVDILAPAVIATLNQDSADIKTVGVRKTPTLFVNGRPLTTFSREAFMDLVDSEVAKL